MQTGIITHTKVDIRKVAECFSADLSMLVHRTKTMSQRWAIDTAHDITLMAVHECLAAIDVQLRDALGNRKAVHQYKVKGIGNWDQDRPGGNNWPDTPGGEMSVIVWYSDQQVASQLKNSGRLRGQWTTSLLNVDYSGMRPSPGRQYSSGSYGWSRSSYIA